MSEWKTNYDKAVATVQDILFNKYKLDPSKYYRCCSGVDAYFDSGIIKKIDKCIDLPGWRIFAWFTLSGPEYYATMEEAIDRFMMIPSYKDVACDRFDPDAPARSVTWKDPKGLANIHFPYYDPKNKKDGCNSFTDDGQLKPNTVNKKLLDKHSCELCPHKYTDICKDCPFNRYSRRDEEKDVHTTCLKRTPYSEQELDIARQGFVRNHVLKGSLSRLDTLLGVTPRRQSETWLWDHGFVPASESFRFTPDTPHNEPSNAISLETDKWTRDIDVVCKTNSNMTFKIKLTVLLIDGKWSVGGGVVAGDYPGAYGLLCSRVKMGERYFKNAELHDTVKEAFEALHVKIEAVYDKLSNIEEQK